MPSGVVSGVGRGMGVEIVEREMGNFGGNVGLPIVTSGHFVACYSLP